jgi:hypothetical protein
LVVTAAAAEEVVLLATEVVREIEEGVVLSVAGVAVAGELAGEIEGVTLVSNVPEAWEVLLSDPLIELVDWETVEVEISPPAAGETTTVSMSGEKEEAVLIVLVDPSIIVTGAIYKVVVKVTSTGPPAGPVEPAAP